MADRIFEILRGRFPEQSFALMQEVSDNAGFNRSRSADFIAVGLWPSRGLEVNGIELKRFRGDWLKELKNPEKQENIFKYCDRFWLLTDNEDIAKIEEIPTSWGWMHIKGSRIFIKKEAPKLEPTPISKGFLVAMLKRAQDKTGYTLTSTIQDKINDSYEKGKEQSTRAITSIQKEFSELHTIVDEFEKSSGISIKRYNRWETNPTKMGEAFKLLQNGGAEKVKEDLIRLEENAKQIHQKILQSINKLNGTTIQKG